MATLPDTLHVYTPHCFSTQLVKSHTAFTLLFGNHKVRVQEMMQTETTRATSEQRQMGHTGCECCYCALLQGAQSSQVSHRAVHGLHHPEIQPQPTYMQCFITENNEVNINHIPLPPPHLFLLVTHSNEPPTHAIVPVCCMQLLKQGNASLPFTHQVQEIL